MTMLEVGQLAERYAAAFGEAATDEIFVINYISDPAFLGLAQAAVESGKALDPARLSRRFGPPYRDEIEE